MYVYTVCSMKYSYWDWDTSVPLKLSFLDFYTQTKDEHETACDP